MTMPSIIFDMDGTPFKTETVLAPALEGAFKNLREQALWHSETPIELYLSILGAPMETIWATLLPGSSDRVRAQADRVFWDSLIKEIKEGTGELYPGAEHTVKWLKEKGCSIYIASNGKMAYLRAILEYYGLDMYMTDVYGADRFQTSSKEDLVKKLAEDYSIRDGIMIGDRSSDISAGLKQSFHTICCTFGYGTAEEWAAAHQTISRLSELKDAVIGRSV
ncbi:MAG TPA: HAD family hydrolase [Bacillaceae bacterium]